ncbi:MAG: TraB/GumN family protein [Saprospiraceae bacterium]|nr:TraB/GumN family protein [Saprospiraceae bacterium]
MKKSKRTLLWGISGGAVKTPSFLFGTMHVRDQLAFSALPQLYACIDQCQALATEFRLDELPSDGTGTARISLASPPLDTLYNPSVYRRMKKALHRYFGLNLDSMKYLPPFFVLNFINEQLLAKDMPMSLDEQLSTYAQSQDKECLGVETLAEQLALLEKIPLKHQLKSLRTMTEKIGSHRRQLLKLGELYAAGDPIRIYKATRAGAGGLRKLLIFDRNRIMADRIAELCQTQATFVAIGAGHLAGGKGVLRFLKHKGLSVHPIPLSSGLNG